jgi:hypothetical protein
MPPSTNNVVPIAWTLSSEASQIAALPISSVALGRLGMRVIVHDDGRACVRKRFGDTVANARTGACDESNLIRE